MMARCQFRTPPSSGGVRNWSGERSGGFGAQGIVEQGKTCQDHQERPILLEILQEKIGDRHVGGQDGEQDGPALVVTPPEDGESGGNAHVHKRVRKVVVETGARVAREQDERG